MKIKMLIGTIFFNLAETYIIFLLGFKIGLSFVNILFIMLLFMLSKGIFGKSLHYKKWYKCLVASATILVTLYFVCKFNELQSFFLTILSSYIMTKNADITIIEFIEENLYHWKHGSKYQLLIDFIQYGYDDIRLLKYEKYLKENDTLKFNLYTLKFKEHKSMEEINEITNIYDNKKIISILDSIYGTLEYTLCLKA